MTDSRETDLGDIPGAVVVKAQNDMDFALKLLHQDTREAALADASLRLTEDERYRLSSVLDEIAAMSFVDALEKIRALGVTNLG